MVGPPVYNIRVRKPFASGFILSCTLAPDGGLVSERCCWLQVSSSGEVVPAGTHVTRSQHAWQETYRSQPEPASLDRMLGSLRADMSRQGVQTPQKGCCNACEKPIVGQVDTASYYWICRLVRASGLASDVCRCCR